MNAVQKYLLPILLPLLLALVFGFVMLRISPMYAAAVLGIPVVIFFLNNQRLLFKSLVVTFFSGLTLPILPGSLNVFHVLALLFIAISIVNGAFRKEMRVPPDGFTRVTIAFLSCVLIVVYFRGFGFRILGDTNWGGLRYVELFIMVGVLLNSKSIVLTQKEWKNTLLVAFAFTFIPFFSELVFIVSGGRFWYHYYVVNIQVATLGAYVREVTGRELVRLQSANRLGSFLMILSMFFLVRSPKKLLASGGLYVSALFLIGISGHRSGFFDLLVFPWMVGFFYFKRHILQYIALSSIAFFAAVLFIYAVAPFLPLQFQRAVSWLPRIQVETVAMDDADGTLQWRFDLWDTAFLELRENPEFLLVGKGLTYSSDEYFAMEYAGPVYTNYMWAVITSTYHQGVISLLVILGIPGLIIGVAFLGIGLFYNRPGKINHAFDPDLKSVQLVIYAYLSLIIAKFFTIYGDLHVSWPVICFWFMLLENLRHSSKIFVAAHEEL